MTGFEHLWITAAALAAMLVLSLTAALLLPNNARVPMQWGSRGKPTWTVPVSVAVMFTPLVAVIALGATQFAAGDGPAIQTTLPSLAMLFLVIHVAHLSFAIRHLRRGAAKRAGIFASRRDTPQPP